MQAKCGFVADEYVECEIMVMTQCSFLSVWDKSQSSPDGFFADRTCWTCLCVVLQFCLQESDEYFDLISSKPIQDSE